MSTGYTEYSPNSGLEFEKEYLIDFFQLLNYIFFTTILENEIYLKSSIFALP